MAGAWFMGLLRSHPAGPWFRRRRGSSGGRPGLPSRVPSWARRPHTPDRNMISGPGPGPLMRPAASSRPSNPRTCSAAARIWQWPGPGGVRPRGGSKRRIPIPDRSAIGRSPEVWMPRCGSSRSLVSCRVWSTTS